MKKGKTLGKRRARPMMMEETKREVQRVAQKTIRELMQNINGYKGSAKEFSMLSDRLNSMAHQGIDVGYIKTLLFPELYNADIPQPMSTQSYCRFTDKKELTINSRMSGMLIWFPKTIIGPQLFIRSGTNIDAPVNIFANGADSTFPYKKGANVNYARYFSQASLVSASISIQYIGQLQKEQGYMVGAQVYGVNCNTVTPEDAETGQFRVMAKPGDGLRMIYLPKDSSDFTYYTCMLAGDNTRSGNNGARQTNLLEVFTPPTTANGWIEGQPPSNYPKTAAGADIKLNYAADADYFVVYWKGLAGESEGTSDLRIDIVRKFNGFPLAEQREVLDLIKPKKLFDPKKTIDVVCELQDVVPQVGGHTLKQMDRISDQIQEFLPNIGHLYNEGLLKEGTTLDGFASQLQSVAGVEGQMSGNPGRLYE